MDEARKISASKHRRFLCTESELLQMIFNWKKRSIFLATKHHCCLRALNVTMLFSCACVDEGGGGMWACVRVCVGGGGGRVCVCVCVCAYARARGLTSCFQSKPKA